MIAFIISIIYILRWNIIFVVAQINQHGNSKHDYLTAKYGKIQFHTSLLKLITYKIYNMHRLELIVINNM
jgi:hypothetical protein